MRIEQIISEFFDYRAYVSHTLCKHRLFLGLSNPESTRLRLEDAAVWPLVCDEAVKLCTSSGTLFGIVSPTLVETQKEILHSINELTILKNKLESNDDSAYKEFKSEVEQLSNALSKIYTVLDDNTPDFDKNATIVYIAGRNTQKILSEVKDHVRIRISPLIKGMLNDNANSSNYYRSFWPESSESYLLTRCAIVAAATEELPNPSIVPIREIQKFLRGLERIVSCWAPNVAIENRPAELEKSLRAEGYGSIDILLDKLDETDSKR
jgi:hypothetical protein